MKTKLRFYICKCGWKGSKKELVAAGKEEYRSKLYCPGCMNGGYLVRPTMARIHISDDRAMQIVNNVAEEYVDLDQTNFATKDELCNTILWLRKQADDERWRLQSALDDIVLRATKTLLRKDENEKLS